MSIRESALSVISSIAQGDFVRAVTSDGNSRRVTVANLAKAVVESYTGSSLGGSQRSVKAAIDSLNSTTNIDIALSTVGDANFILTTNRSGKKNGIYIVDITLKAKQNISSTSEMNIGTVSIGPLASIGTAAVRSNDTKVVGALLISNSKGMYLRLTEPISANQTIVVSMCGY